MKTILLFLILKTASSDLSSTFCDCIPSSDTFFGNLDHDHEFVAHIKILENIDYKAGLDFRGFTKVIVIKQFGKTHLPDTILHFNSSGASCGTSIRGNKNEELIIKGYSRIKVRENNGFTYDFPMENEKFKYLNDSYSQFSVSLCDQSTLIVKNEFVYGQITKSKRKNIMKRFMLLNKLSNEIGDWYLEKTKDKGIQKIKLKRIYRKITQTLKNK